jgi:hypothetical protein
VSAENFKTVGANGEKDPREGIYWPEVMSASGRLISQLDREPQSASYGSFDREHWAWKFRDFPIGVLQCAAYPLAMLWKFPLAGNPYYANERVLDWIVASIEKTISRQHANGSFDGFSPYEQHPGSTLFILHGLSEAFRIIRERVPGEVESRFVTALRKGCEFSMRREEDHAFVSNHWALFAVAFLDAQELLGEPKYGTQAEEIVARIQREQSADGWYREYDGPDPGYESLGIFHLAAYWQRTRSKPLLDSLRRSVEFYAHCVHPDGSVGGNYGSRLTMHYFPGGFEILSGELPKAAAIAKFLRERLGRHNVLTPSVTDTENLVPLLYTYLEACVAPEFGTEKGAAPQLPCEELEGAHHFRDAQVQFVGTRRYYAVVNAGRGGVCRIFDRRSEKVAYEDSGYVVSGGGRRWTSQRLVPGARVKRDNPMDLTCETMFAEVHQELPTPAKFILLRLLNLTAFRSLRLGNWLRKQITRRLITQMRIGPLRLRRSIQFREAEIRFRDRIELTKPAMVEEVALPRAFLPIHMGSAKYFQESELEATPRVPVHAMARELTRTRKAQCEFALQFSGSSEPRLEVGEAAPAHVEALLSQ